MNDIAKNKNNQADLYPPGTHVITYTRDSPGSNQTVESQIMGIKQYIVEHGWIVDAEYKDEWRSGKSTESRDGFMSMVSDAKFRRHHKATVVVVWSFSRFARNHDESIFYKVLLKQYGLQLISVSDNIALNDPMAPLIQAFVHMMDEHFLAGLKSGTRRGLLFIASSGCVPTGKIPYGYSHTAQFIGLRKDGTARMGRKPQIQNDQAQLVRKAFELKAIGTPYEEIAAQAPIFAPTAVGSWNRFFHNPAYVGVLEFQDQIFKNVFPAIIDQDLFDKVQSLIPPKPERIITENHPRRRRLQYLFVRFAVCGYCGSPVEGKSVGNHRYYVCARHNTRVSECPQSKLLPARDFDEAILGMLADQLFDENNLGELLVWTNRELNVGLDQVEIQLEAVRKQFKSESSELLTMRRNALLYGWGDEADTIHIIDDKQRRILELGERINQLEDVYKNSRIDVSPEDLKNFISHASDIFQGANRYMVRGLCELFISKIIIRADEVEIELQFPDSIQIVAE